jgi:hypothetical protein
MRANPSLMGAETPLFSIMPPCSAVNEFELIEHANVKRINLHQVAEAAPVFG